MKLAPQLAVIDGGLHHENAFEAVRKNNRHLVHTGKILHECLRKYDIVVVPFHTDNFILRRKKKDFESFMNHGGILVLLGMIRVDGNWLCNWEDPKDLVGDVEATSVPDSEKIFSGIDPKTIKFHGPHLPPVHGSLSEGGDKISLAKVSDKCIMFVQPWGAGKLLVTTLDPDHHVHPVMPLPRDSTPLKLLENILEWAEAEAGKKSIWRKGFNRAWATIATTVSKHFLLILSVLFIISFVYNVIPESKKIPDILNGVGSILSGLAWYRSYFVRT